MRIINEVQFNDNDIKEYQKTIYMNIIKGKSYVKGPIYSGNNLLLGWNLLQTPLNKVFLNINP